MITLELDEEQQKIVDYEGSTLVVAGPGSGKTRVLVAKAEKLYNEGKDLVCLTFTRSAAREMRKRMPDINARTIHSFCYSISGWVGDYDTLLTGFLVAQEKGYLQETYDWVLVDEVQDLTNLQWNVVKSLVKENLFAVGDPYQSIYGWNGAMGLSIVKELLEFGCKEFYLKNNYRSCPEVVSMLNKIYSRDLVSKGTKETGLTAVLARTNRKVETIARSLDYVGIGYTIRFGANELSKAREEFRGNTELKVMTCHCSKGLEFDTVINYSPDGGDFFLPSDNEGSNWPSYYPSHEEKNLYYVSNARASRKYLEVWSVDQLLKVISLKGRLI